ncbi:MAG: sucrose phosphorylase [Nocardioides sp.]
MTGAVELIAYADRLGGSLPGLGEVLDGPLTGLFGGVHLLPFFVPYDGADAGFDPADHTAVDPRLGSWEDIGRIAQDHRVMVDVIVNHVSSSSPMFLDWLEHGDRSAHDGMFLTLDSGFPGGVREADLLRLYRPRPGLPFTAYAQADGRRRMMWTTFTPQQIDVDVRHPSTRDYLQSVLNRLADAKVTRVRMDAVGYAVKTPGTSSFMTPETFAFIDEVTGWCHERGMDSLVEVHSYYRQQVEIAGRVDLVYDFALPPLVLHALIAADADPLLNWLRSRPENAINVLDTHDGIGVVDVAADATDRSRAGLLAPEQIDRLVESIHANSGGTSRLATGAAASNLDLYQVNCTFYDALGADDDAYLSARAIQFWTPGIPQVYYVGLLAGRNDMELLERTNVGRDVNRHCYTAAEIATELRRPVVQSLCRLIRFRNTHPAFDGEFSSAGGDDRLVMVWAAGDDRAELEVDLTTRRATVRWTHQGTTREAPLADLPT